MVTHPRGMNDPEAVGVSDTEQWPVRCSGFGLHAKREVRVWIGGERFEYKIAWTNELSTVTTI